MYYCNNCGSINEGMPKKETMLPEVKGEQPASYLVYDVCANCGSEDIEEAEYCGACKSYFKAEGYGYGCTDCRDKIARGFNNIKDYFIATYNAKPEDVEEVMTSVYEDIDLC